MGAEVDSLEIVIESTVDEANKSLDELIQKLGRVAEGLSALAKNSALSDLRKSFSAASQNSGESLTSINKQIKDQTLALAKNVSKSLEEIRKQYAEVGKGFTMSGSEKQIQKKVDSLTNALVNARLKQQELEASGNTGGQSYEKAVASVVKYENQIESLKSQLEALRQAEIEAAAAAQEVAATKSNPNEFTGTIDGEFPKLDDMFDVHDVSELFGDNVKENITEVQDAVKVAVSDMQYNADAMAATFGEAAAQIRDWAQATAEYGAQAGQAFNNPEMFQQTAQGLENIRQQTRNLAGEFRNMKDLMIKSFKDLINGNVFKYLTNSAKEYIQQAQIAAGIKIQSDDGSIRQAPGLANQSALKTSVAVASQAMGGIKNGIASFAQSIPGVVGKIPLIGRAAKETAYLAQKSFAGMSAPLKAIKKPVLALASSIKSKLAKAFSGLTGASKGTHNSLLKNLGTILRYAIGVRTLFALVNKLRKAFTDGMQNLVKYSNETNASMSLLMNSTNQLKNSVAAAGAPILNALAPALNTIIQMCINAANAVNQLFSALTGHGTWIKATKQTQDYAKSLGGASKAADDLKTHTLGIDELNVVDQNKNGESGGSGGGASAADMFETQDIDSKYKEWADKIKAMWNAGDFTELGSAVGKWLKNGLDSIPWDGIQESARRIASSIGTFINGFVETEGLATSIGTTIGQAVNTAVDFANTFLDVTHWDSIGKFIGEGLNGIVNSVQWDELGQMFANGLNAAFTVLENAATTFSWTNFGNSLALSFNTFASTFSWSGAATSLSSLVNGLLDSLISFVGETDWGVFGEGVMDFLVGIDWGGLAEGLVSSAVLIVEGLYGFLAGAITSVNWQQIGINIVNELVKVVTTIDYAGLVSSAYTYLGAAIGASFALAAGVGQAVWNQLVAGFNATIAYFDTYIQTAGGNIIQGLYNGIVDALKSVGQWILDNIFTPFIDGFKAAFGIHSPSTVMAEMGGYLMEGLINGIKDGWNNIKESVGNVAKGVIDKFKDVLGIHSPSTVMDENGVYLIEGLHNGISDTINDVYDIFSESKWKEIGQGMLDGLLRPFKGSDGIDTISTFATDVFNTISNTLSEEQLGSIGTAAVSGLANSFTTAALDPIFGNIKTSLMNAWNQTASWWQGTAMPNFFNSNVSPWFTSEKWKTTTDGMKVGLIAKWDEFVSQWKTKTNAWWNTNVKTWFTIEKWKEQGDHFKTALLDKWTEFETQWNTNINNWFTNNVSTWFTKEKWEPFGINMKDGVYDGFKGIVQKVGELVNGMIDLFNTGLSRIAEAMNNLISDYNDAADEMEEDTISGVHFRAISHVDIPRYAAGGFPEDGLFFANHNEMVGQFSNGKTAVANNDQIIAGITAGVKAAVVDVLAPYLSQIADNTKETAEKNMSISLDGRELVSGVNSRISRNGFSFT